MNAPLYDRLFSPESPSAAETNPDIAPAGVQVHQSVAALFVEGNSPTQIANKLKLAPEKVRLLLKQEHTQRCVKELVADQGESGIESLLRATEVDNVLKLIEIRDSETTTANVKIQAISKLFELQRGKVPYGGKDGEEAPTGKNLKDRMALIDNQIKELQQKKSS